MKRADEDTRRERAQGLYEEFHGRPSEEDLEIDLPELDDGDIPESTTRLGRLIALEYEATKDHDTGETEIYRHVFEDGGHVLTTPEGERIIYLVGDFSVEDVGIIDDSQKER